MLKQTQREIAISAARSYLRKQGIDPLAVDVEDAFLALDDLLRIDDTLIASVWYVQKSKNQEKLFIKEWNEWQRNWRVVNRLTRQAMKRLNCKNPNFDEISASLDELDRHLRSEYNEH